MYSLSQTLLDAGLPETDLQGLLVRGPNVRLLRTPMVSPDKVLLITSTTQAWMAQIERLGQVDLRRMTMDLRTRRYAKDFVMPNLHAALMEAFHAKKSSDIRQVLSAAPLVIQLNVMFDVLTFSFAPHAEMCPDARSTHRLRLSCQETLDRLKDGFLWPLGPGALRLDITLAYSSKHARLQWMDDTRGSSCSTPIS